MRKVQLLHLLCRQIFVCQEYIFLVIISVGLGFFNQSLKKEDYASYKMKLYKISLYAALLIFANHGPNCAQLAHPSPIIKLCNFAYFSW